jgi:hypothetical protein
MRGGQLLHAVVTRILPRPFNIFVGLLAHEANADGVVGGEPASHHVDPGSIPGSGVVICD